MGNNLSLAEINIQVGQMSNEFSRDAKQIQAVLPAHIDLKKFMRVAITAVRNNPDLLFAPYEMFLNECVKAATDGLLPDGREGALVPRGNPKNGRKVSLTWQPMIAGIRKKARNSGEITSWDCYAAYANDIFHVKLGDDPRIVHEIDFSKEERGDLIAVYSVCKLKDGSKSMDVMKRSDVDKIRDRSDAYKAFKAGYISSTPWVTDYDQMAIKTMAKRHSKMLPMSSDLDELMRRDDDFYKASDDDQQQRMAESQPRRQQSLENRLNDLGGDDEGTVIDGETGEVVDGKKAEKGKGGKDSDDSKGAPSGEIEAAREKGKADRKAGKAKRDIPAKYRKDDELREAYVEGFDSTDENDFPGDE